MKLRENSVTKIIVCKDPNAFICLLVIGNYIIINCFSKYKVNKHINIQFIY